MAPAATVIDAAVTDEASAAPTAYVPADAADHVPMWVTAVPPEVANVSADELVIDPPDAAFHEQACRA